MIDDIVSELGEYKMFDQYTKHGLSHELQLHARQKCA